MRKIRITNDSGNGKLTTIRDYDTGQPITDVCAVEISIPMDGIVRAKLTHVLPVVDIIAFVDEDQDVEKQPVTVTAYCPHPYGPCTCRNGIGCANDLESW